MVGRGSSGFAEVVAKEVRKFCEKYHIARVEEPVAEAHLNG